MLVTDAFGLLPLRKDVSLHFVPLSVTILAYIDTARAHEHVGHFFAVGESNMAMDPVGNSRVRMPRALEEYDRMSLDKSHLVGQSSTVRSSSWDRTAIR